MSESEQPRRASFEYLKKLAKKRLGELRESKPEAKLADTQLIIAREAGFSSWRQLKAEFDKRDLLEASPFFSACANGHVEKVRELLALDSRLANAIDPNAERSAWSALHTAVQSNQLAIVLLLIEHGADANVREGWGNASPLHLAANHGNVAIVRALLSAGADAVGAGDTHGLEVIGWATQFNPHRSAKDTITVLALLQEHGATHHIYSAISTGDIEIVRAVLLGDDQALRRHAALLDQTPLAWAIGHRHYDMIELLVQHGAQLEQLNANGHTVLAEAVLDGNVEAVKRLRAAGAREQTHSTVAEVLTRNPGLISSVSKAVPMITVPDIPETLDWYKAIGFTEVGRYWENNELRWATMTFGGARVMLSLGQPQSVRDLKLWFYTSRIDDVYELVKARQMEVAHLVLAGELQHRSLIRFIREINNPPYGSREFAMRDLNGYALYFIQLPAQNASAEQ